MSRLFDVQSDLDLYRKWRVSARASAEWEASWSPLVADAYVVIADNIGALAARPLDLSGMELWCRLWDSLCAVSRIVSVPAMHGEGISSWEYVDSVCTFAMICFSIADSGSTSILALTDRDLSRKVAPLRLDVVCGRGGIWAAMALDMARVTGAIVGADGSMMADAMARLRVNALAQRVADSSGVPVSDAASSMGGAMLDLASIFDDWQYRGHRSSRMSWFDISADSMRLLMREQVLVSYADALVPRSDPSICRGWCADLCVTPVASLFALPRDLESSISESYFKKHVAELMTVMYGGEL